MAQVKHRTSDAEWIDRSLSYLEAEWEQVPQVAAEWADWDEADRVDFVLEWPLREDALRQLQQWSADGQFTALQLQRLRELQRLVQRNRAALELLLAD